jgi:tRNA-modifying protein YgfZ
MTTISPSTIDAINVPLSGACALDDIGLIRAEGVDAASFLQGQLTQDVAALDTTRATLAGYCSAKGRLLASLVVWRPADDVFLLACGKDVLAPTLKRLSMFVLRAKCKLTEVQDARIVGVWGSRLDDAVRRSGPWSRSGSFVRWPDALGMSRAWRIDGAESSPESNDLCAAWNLLNVAGGMPRIASTTVDAFVPQMINFELVGGVSFRKGCYPGQEVVARSQYRGTLKRRMFLFASSAPGQAVHAGEEVFHADDPTQPAGTVVDAASFGNGPTLALVSMKSALTTGGAARVHIGSIDGPAFDFRPMPYPVPLEATD